MRNLIAANPAVDYLTTMLRARIALVRTAAEGEGEERSLGASAVEWAVITLIVLVIVTGVGYVIYNAVNTKAGDISTCMNNQNNGITTSCAP